MSRYVPDVVTSKMSPAPPDMLASADETAREIVRAIRDNVFWPPSDDGGLMSEFAEICLETTILESDEEEDS